MVERAEASGRIKPGDTLIEPTSGNTGIGLALVGAVKGYKTIITLPEKMSAEKVAVLQALGAEIIRTPTQAAHDSPESHIGLAKRLVKEIPNSHILDQYGNEDNPLAHEFGTAEEIWKQTGGRIDLLVAGAGTGGTVTGLARGLNKNGRKVKIVAADPYGSVLALPKSLNTQNVDESYKVEGIGYDFIPEVLEQKTVDKWYKTDDREAFMYARRLIAEEGLLVGGSSGSAMAAAVRAIKDYDLGEDSVVVVILPDSIRSYLSRFVSDDYLAAHDLLTDLPSHESSTMQPTIRALRLKPITTVSPEAPLSEAIEVMRDKGFDQLPVISMPGKRLVGLITLGNMLSFISSGKCTPKSLIREVMFNFATADSSNGPMKHIHSPVDRVNAEFGWLSNKDGQSTESLKKKHRSSFVEITMDTPLDELNRFFQWNSAAVVTEKIQGNQSLKPVAIVTKVDLLQWMVKNPQNSL